MEINEASVAELLEAMVAKMQEKQKSYGANGDAQYHLKRSAKALAEVARALSCAKRADQGYAIASLNEVPECDRLPYCNADEII
jgi:hypothetical protein